MIILRTPKGWTGPDEVDGVQMLGTWRAHQVPLSGVKDNPEHLAILEQWLRSYRPEELFDADGAPDRARAARQPRGRPADERARRTPTAACSPATSTCPTSATTPSTCRRPATVRAESTRKLGELMRDIYRANDDRFRLFCPDETNSNRLGAVFEVVGPRVHGAGRPGGRVALAATAG